MGLHGDTKLLLTAVLANPVDCTSLGLMLKGQHCSLSPNGCFSPSLASHPPSACPSLIESIHDITETEKLSKNQQHSITINYASARVHTYAYIQYNFHIIFSLVAQSFYIQNCAKLHYASLLLLLEICNKITKKSCEQIIPFANSNTCRFNPLIHTFLK